MLVTTATVGDRRRNDPSLSSASATRNSPWPSFALDPRLLSFPPTTAVGSQPAAARTVATIEVVVVLPWVPAMAIPYFIRINSASISARGMTGIFRRCASTTSGLSFFTAEETTTTCPSSGTFSAACPIPITAPSRDRRSVVSERRRSDPLTRYPRLSRSSAMPLIPIPPMPTKWMRSPFLYTKRPLPLPDLAERRPDDPLGRVRPGICRGGGPGGRPEAGVGGPRGKRLQDPFPCGLLLPHPHPRSAGAEFPGVHLLMPVRGERVRDEDAGLSEQGGLRDRKGSRPHEDRVAPFERFPDPLREGERLDREPLRPDGLLRRFVLAGAGLQRERHRAPFPFHPPAHLEDQRIDRARPLRSAQREDAEAGTRSSRGTGPPGGDDFPPDRVSRGLGAAGRARGGRPLKSRVHFPRHPPQRPVRPARHGVLLLEEKGDAGRRRGDGNRDGGVPADPEDQVRSAAPQDRERGGDPLHHAPHTEKPSRPLGLGRPRQVDTVLTRARPN